MFISKATKLAMIGVLSLPGGPALADAAANRAQINKVYNAWDEAAWKQLLSVKLEATNQPVVKDGRVEDRDRVVTCTSKKVTAGLNEWVTEASLLNPTSTSVWPGSLIYADRQLAEGTPTPIRVDRAPVTIRVNLPGLSGNAGTKTIPDPTNVSVKNAVSDLVVNWLNTAGKTNAPPERIFSQSEKAYSTQQIGVDLGFSGQWASGSASGAMKVNSSSKETVVLKMIKQVYYSAEIEIAGGVESYFANSVTLDDSVISTAKPPAVVTNVDYGRILIAQMRVSEAITTAHAEAAMSYAAGDNKVSGNVSTDIANTAKNAQFRVIAIGGGATSDTGTELFNGDFSGFGKAIKEDFVFSAQSPAAPISYSVASLDGQLRKMNATTDYVEHDCQEFPNRSVELKSTGGYVSKFAITYMVPKGPDGTLLPVVWASGDKTSPYQSGKIYIPGDAKSINIVGQEYTGLVWDPVRTPLNVRGDSLTKQHNCFKISGTTLNPNMSRCD